MQTRRSTDVQECGLISAYNIEDYQQSGER